MGLFFVARVPGLGAGLGLLGPVPGMRFRAAGRRLEGLLDLGNELAKHECRLRLSRPPQAIATLQKARLQAGQKKARPLAGALRVS
jgi:hypothetical protein